MHQEWMHPYFQNDEFQRWKMWHQYLEEQEEKKMAYIRRAEETFLMFSLWYLKERRLREWGFLQAVRPHVVIV